MAHFIGYVQGSRGEASRLGGKDSGLQVEAKGWNVGAKIYLTHDKDTGKDIVVVYKTGGSNGASTDEKIAEFTNK